MRKSLNENEKYLISLLKSVLHGLPVEEVPKNVNMETVFRIAHFHSVANMAYYAVKNMKNLSPELLKKWKEEYDKAQLKDVIQRIELNLISKTFEQEGIDHLPVKGFVLKELYPKSDMRAMSDLDILIPPDKAENARDAMVKIGYTVEHYDGGVQDVYFKPPVMNVEIHNNLFMEAMKNSVDYYKEFAKKLFSENSKTRRRYISDEEAYAYVIAHTSKHYRGGGTGIRSVLDVYVLCEKKPELVASESFLNILKKQKLLEFFKHISNLSKVWFGNMESTPLYDEMGAYVMISGTYGTRTGEILNRVSEGYKGSLAKSKVSNVMKRCFPPLYIMKTQYRWLKKYPWLLPVSYPMRFGAVLVHRRKNLDVFSNTANVSEEEAKQINTLHKNTGIFTD